MNADLPLIDTESEPLRQAIRAPLARFNEQHLGPHRQRPLMIPLRAADGDVVGGLSAFTADGWLYTEFLFVPEAQRRQGLASRLMARAEAEARARGCRGSWLGTLDFQARGFYERLGYRCFGELHDHPAGHTLFFLKKNLAHASPTPGG